ncbi:tRNA (N6-isopentenyl adenosine(37)-C2)-methylthiotransferase MiaB [Candidatus Epulonipiscium viviparus]|uniref:tRNA (N6-isopentenyl adenosine(37)-C2)-methylthiotransferase MiaB n=1 Tax=Candidatus Epulonipiscium viviparus TaxID=420336 RepID=UPI000497807D|nr:tRNA (N6-isopentenyl adenosine(37)-C2)-methylthiotransferase MiaB [Candidatus Epulopiscium viviparus]
MSKRLEVKITTEEAKRQDEIISKLSQHIKDKGLTFFIGTFGCQMNALDSEKIEGVLTKLGYTKAASEKTADFLIYNTCCVRENAELKIFGKLGALKHRKKKQPNFMVALCGCMMQQDVVLKTLKQKYKFVDIIFGTYNIYKLPELLQTRIETGENIIDIWETHQEIVEDLPSIRKHQFKSCVNIMYGCNNFCTYCIVPYVRGRERSREVDDIYDQVKALVDDGVKEIMLLGQNVNSYGKNLATKPTFTDLLERLASIDGLKRIRFMTSHPKDFSDQLIDSIAKHDNICKGLHLPIQSGSTRILQQMNRGYTREEYLDLVAKIKKAIPSATLTTDIIVGFPGESDSDFADTLDVVTQIQYLSAFTFIYSKRTGTPAATMENQVDEDVIKARFNQLVAAVNTIAADFMAAQIGNTYEILLEDSSKNDATMLSGRTDTGILVHVKAPLNFIGEFVTVQITNSKTHYLVGEIKVSEDL